MTCSCSPWYRQPGRGVCNRNHVTSEHLISSLPAVARCTTLKNRRHRLQVTGYRLQKCVIGYHLMTCSCSPWYRQPGRGVCKRNHVTSEHLMDSCLFTSSLPAVARGTTLKNRRHRLQVTGYRVRRCGVAFHFDDMQQLTMVQANKQRGL